MAAPPRHDSTAKGFDTGQVKDYYDRHTGEFLATGQRGSEGAIHRAVWGPGVQSRQQAFRYVEDRLIDLLNSVAAPPTSLHVVDLGCGVGASLCYLAARLPIRGTGITLSAVQARLGGQRIREAGFADRLRCLEGDFTNLPADIEPADLTFAIESFVHAPDPGRFFDECARLVRPGGLLVLCDDFLRPTSDREAERTLDRFRRGWHINTLIDAGELQTLARASGFEHESTQDLTSYLELRRARDRAIGGLLALVGWLPLTRRFDYLIGGQALQTCLARGWIGYDLTVFRFAHTLRIGQ
jgi:SAM-dependent methyltransferase